MREYHFVIVNVETGKTLFHERCKSLKKIAERCPNLSYKEVCDIVNGKLQIPEYRIQKIITQEERYDYFGL